ncbi:hypothetical protein DAI22_07g222300 [Oryza sativa Japonica Group]|nr:hypothetical protein DAI22_07g222300 [Oryza sativa Japonica Group]
MARTTELVVFLAGLLLSAAAEEAETYASRLIQNDHLGYIIEEPKLQVASTVDMVATPYLLLVTVPILVHTRALAFSPALSDCRCSMWRCPCS